MEICETKNKTDKAFIEFLYRFKSPISIQKDKYLKNEGSYKQFPFDSKKKRMTTTCVGFENLGSVKGAAPVRNFGDIITELVSCGRFDQEKEERDCETDSAQTTVCNSLTQSFSDGEDPVQSDAKMEDVVAEVVTSPKKKSVRWADTVTVREECYDDSSKKYDSVDSVKKMKKAAAVKPSVEPVIFDAKEQAIRSKLVGLIPAGKKRHHDYGRMYGCGPCLTRTDSCTNLDEESSDSEDDDEIREPVRVIHASAPSAMWFSAALF